MPIGMLRRIGATRATRDIAIQGLFLAVFVAVIGTMTYQFNVNTAKVGLSYGYDFLWRPTGWNVSTSLLPHTPNSPYWWTFLVGLLNSLSLGLLCVATTTVAGFALGIALVSPNYLLSTLATVYVAVFRNVPAILQMFFWYNLLKHLPGERQALSIAGIGFLSNRGLVTSVPNGDGFAALTVLGVTVIACGIAGWSALAKPRLRWRLVLLAVAGGVASIALVAGPHLRIDRPVLQGFGYVGGMRLTTELLALFVALTCYSCAFIGEIVRGGMLAVHPGQIEAGRALGLPNWLIKWKIQIPLALRAILPAISNQHLFTMKLTSLGAAIGYSDLFAVTSISINQTGQTIELLAIMVGLYFVTNYAMAVGMHQINQAFALKGRS
jgi:general L-amino acid transport system permease protein